MAGAHLSCVLGKGLGRDSVGLWSGKAAATAWISLLILAAATSGTARHGTRAMHPFLPFKACAGLEWEQEWAQHGKASRCRVGLDPETKLFVWRSKEWSLERWWNTDTWARLGERTPP